MPSRKINKILLAAKVFEKQASTYEQLHSLLEGLLSKKISLKDFNAWKEDNESRLDKVIFLDWKLEDGDLIAHKKLPDGPELLRVISKEDAIPVNLFSDVQQKDIIYGNYKGIPDLFLFKGTVDNTSLMYYSSTEMAHENWLVSAIFSLFELHASKQTIDQIKQFIKDNKVKINSIRSHFYGTPKLLGQGADGVAYSISPSAVLKIFKSPGAYKKTKEAIERIFKHPDLAKTEAMIYDIGELGNFNGRKLYYYLIEKMVPFSQIENKTNLSLDWVIYSFPEVLLNDPDFKFYSMQKIFKEPEHHNYIKNIVKNKARELIDEKFYDTLNKVEEKIKLVGGPPLRSDWKESFIEELIMKYLSERKDLHTGNLGITGYGHLRYYDPVYDPRG